MPRPKTKSDSRCPICDDPRGGCSSLESATPIDGREWCSLLECAFAAKRDGVKRRKNGNFPAGWYNSYCRRAGAGTWGDNPERREQIRAVLIIAEVYGQDQTARAGSGGSGSSGRSIVANSTLNLSMGHNTRARG